MAKAMSLEAFQCLLQDNVEFRTEVTGRSDVIDFDNGTATIYSENVNKYLSQYACKSAEDLSDTLWQSYGVFVRIIE